MIKHVHIQEKRIDSQRDVLIKNGPSKGQTKKVFNCSVKIKGVWYKGAVWNEMDFTNIGDTAYLNFYKKEYKGEKYNNWRLPTQSELDVFRIDNLEQRVTVLENYLRENKTNV